MVVSRVTLLTAAKSYLRLLFALGEHGTFPPPKLQHYNTEYIDSNDVVMVAGSVWESKPVFSQLVYITALFPSFERCTL